MLVVDITSTLFLNKHTIVVLHMDTSEPVG